MKLYASFLLHIQRTFETNSAALNSPAQPTLYLRLSLGHVLVIQPLFESALRIVFSEFHLSLCRSYSIFMDVILLMTILAVSTTKVHNLLTVSRI